MNNSSGDILKREAKYRLMTGTPVSHLIVRFAIPTIISMMVTALYNMADAYFVGNLSTHAVAGVGVAFAFQALIQAVGFFFGSGAGTFISRALGSKDMDGAERMASTGFFTPLLLGAVIATIGLVFLPGLAHVLGATPEIVPSACDYLRWLLVAMPFMVSQMALNNQLRMQGGAWFAMIGIASGCVLNIVLDPIFIFTLGLGVSGASLATLVCQVFSWCILLWGTTRNGYVHIRFSNFTPTMHMMKEITAGGLPSLMRQALGSLSTICVNWAAAHYAAPGTEASAIAAFAIVSRVMICAMSVILGLGQGFQPVVGFNWGAQKYGRVRSAYLFTMRTTCLLIVAMSIVGYAFAPQIVSFFRSEDPDLIVMGARILRWQCIAFVTVSVTTPTNMLLQNIRRTMPATILAMSRQGIFFYPAILIMPRIWGIEGLMATLAVADTCTFILALPMCIAILRELRERMQH